MAIVHLEGNLVRWRSKKQTIVAMSTVEAEQGYSSHHLQGYLTYNSWLSI